MEISRKHCKGDTLFSVDNKDEAVFIANLMPVLIVVIVEGIMEFGSLLVAVLTFTNVIGNPRNVAPGGLLIAFSDVIEKRNQVKVILSLNSRTTIQDNNKSDHILECTLS
uniref:Amino acid transporter n=1 Tax=Ascaris lumbricoides TaxID=6252 RepID=A0A0M3I341_ASCLU